MSKSITFKTGNNNHLSKVIVNGLIEQKKNNNVIVSYQLQPSFIDLSDKAVVKKQTVKNITCNNGDVLITSGLRVNEMLKLLENLEHGMQPYDAYIESLTDEQEKQNCQSYEHKFTKLSCVQFVDKASKDVALIVEFINRLICSLGSSDVNFRGVVYNWNEVKTILEGLRQLNDKTINLNLKRFIDCYNEYRQVA